MTRVVHLTAHLGGGVGRALASLVRARRLAEPDSEHRIVCLETPEKTGFVEEIRSLGGSVIVAPTPAALAAEVARADLVQIEFWNHPALLRALCETDWPAMRLLVWCHVSGLNFPRIPAALVGQSDRFVLTSACSWQAPDMAALPARLRERVAVVSSAAGLENLPQRPAHATTAAGSGPRCRFGYLGSLNLAKLHPDYVALLSHVDEPDFNVRMIGDPLNRALLERQAAQAGHPGRLTFPGYCSDIAGELGSMDVLLYLLNPSHYGTAEIALLEAMAMGVVPVVMPNAAECQVVEHGVNGLVVRDADELAHAVHRLSGDGAWLRALGERAAASVRGRDTLACLGDGLRTQYQAALDSPKRVRDFRSVFGTAPARWFTGFVPDGAVFGREGSVTLPQGPARHLHLERTKGTAMHFQQHFPGDPQLDAWARNLMGQTVEST
ncbi:MAG TPA: glycosyltransferase family 4 protein [Burkholderiaceae bacterium]|jgi:glycosyltransferase involved in cell wall biosynthesis|nr:glycosyltransferase family 4 protein [Burkholderiaceae bacterium]